MSALDGVRMRPLTIRRRHRLVSVVIPCYDYARYLPAAVASVLEQQGVDLDVVIVDDASTDDSRAVAEALAADDPRIRVLAHEENRGHIATYNDGLALARGDYVVLLSADDLLAPGCLARAVALMEAHPEVGLVYGYPETFSGERPLAARERRTDWTTWTGRVWLDRMCARGSNTIVNPEAVLRASVLDRIGGYDPALPQTADMDLWMRAAAVSGVGRINGPVQGYYRVHGDNMHLTSLAGDLLEMEARLRTFENFFAEPELDDEDDTAEERLSVARRAIATEAVRTATRLRSSPDPESRAAADGFAALAEEAWPAITRSAAWRRAEHRGRRPVPPALARAEQLADRVRWSLRWRRWRRSGT